MAPADVVDGSGLAERAQDRPVMGKSVPGVAERVRVARLVLSHVKQKLVSSRLARPIAKLAEKPEALRQMLARLIVVARPGTGLAEDKPRGCLCRRVAKADRGRERDALSRCPIVPVSSPVKKVGHGPGKLPGTRIASRPGGKGDGGQEDVVFGVEPVQGVLETADALDSDRRRWRRERDRVTKRPQPQGGDARGVQVVIEDPVKRTLVGGYLPGSDLLGGVGPQQVVHGIPAGDKLADQVRPGQLAQVGARLRRWRAGQAGDQPGQLTSAGHQHEAAWTSWQERAHLLFVFGIVKQHEHAPARQDAAIQASLSVDACRNSFGRDAKGFQEATYRRRRGHRLSRGVKPAQVQIELPVREPVRYLMSPLHRERGLADPGGAGDSGGLRRR